MRKVIFSGNVSKASQWKRWAENKLDNLKRLFSSLPIFQKKYYLSNAIVHVGQFHTRDEIYIQGADGNLMVGMSRLTGTHPIPLVYAIYGYDAIPTLSPFPYLIDTHFPDVPGSGLHPKVGSIAIGSRDYKGDGRICFGGAIEHQMGRHLFFQLPGREVTILVLPSISHLIWPMRISFITDGGLTKYLKDGLLLMPHDTYQHPMFPVTLKKVTNVDSFFDSLATCSELLFIPYDGSPPVSISRPESSSQERGRYNLLFSDRKSLSVYRSFCDNHPTVPQYSLFINVYKDQLDFENKQFVSSQESGIVERTNNVNTVTFLNPALRQFLLAKDEEMPFVDNRRSYRSFSRSYSYLDSLKTPSSIQLSKYGDKGFYLDFYPDLQDSRIRIRYNQTILHSFDDLVYTRITNPNQGLYDLVAFDTIPIFRKAFYPAEIYHSEKHDVMIYFLGDLQNIVHHDLSVFVEDDKWITIGGVQVPPAGVLYLGEGKVTEIISTVSLYACINGEVFPLTRRDGAPFTVTGREAIVTLYPRLFVFHTGINNIYGNEILKYFYGANTFYPWSNVGTNIDGTPVGQSLLPDRFYISSDGPAVLIHFDEFEFRSYCSIAANTLWDSYHARNNEIVECEYLIYPFQDPVRVLDDPERVPIVDKHFFIQYEGQPLRRLNVPYDFIQFEDGNITGRPYTHGVSLFHFGGENE